MMMTDTTNKTDPTKLMRLLLLTVTLSSMTALMFNIVLPQVSEEFQLSYAEVSWLSSGYTIIYAFGTVTYGKLSDRFRLKNLLTFGLLLFAIGSLAGLFSTTYWMALVGRFLQSIGASCVPALAMIIPTRYVAQERRGQALAMTAVGVALGSALAPVVSALITTVAHWRWLFVPPLFVLLLLPLYRKYLADDTKGTAGAFDWPGGGLLAATVASVLLGVTNRNVILIAIGLVILTLFVLHIRSASEPFVRPELFRNKGYSLALILAFVINAIGISLYFLTPKLLSEVYRLDSDWIGFAMVPAAVASSIFGRKGGKLADRKGNPFLFRIASTSLITCFLLLSVFAGISPLWISVFLIFGNVGQSLIGIAMSNTISQTLPREQVGIGMGLFSMLNFIAQGMAAGVYSIASEGNTPVSWNPLHTDPGSSLYSNIYLVLAALHVAILLVYPLYIRKRQQGGRHR